METERKARRPRCKNCRGEMVEVLVSYGTRDLYTEYECIKCGKVMKSLENNKKNDRRRPRR